MLFTFLFSLSITLSSAHAAVDDNILKLAQLKQQNYQTAEKFYQEQKVNLTQSKIELFCKRSEEIYTALFSILEDDLKLLQALINTQNEDYVDYAKHLDENSRSDIFAFYSYIERCKNRSEFIPDEILASIENSFINLKFLNYSHKLWMESLNKK